jgi:hypothetical protein
MPALPSTARLDKGHCRSRSADRHGFEHSCELVCRSLNRRAAAFDTRLDQSALQRRGTKNGETFRARIRPAIDDQLVFDNVNPGGISLTASLGYASVPPMAS